MTNFDAIRSRDKTPTGQACRVCGKPNGGYVQIRLTSNNPASPKVNGATVATAAVTLCEEHASDLFLQLEEKIDAVRVGGWRE
jgi:hypothetical protein